MFYCNTNYIGHVGIVYSLTVLKTPGKMRLFSASYDKTIRVSIPAIPNLSLVEMFH